MATALEVPILLDIPEKLTPIITKFNNYRYAICEGGRGCFDPDTPMLMYDGAIKPMRDVKIGDLLRGWDNTPRKVIETHAGKDDMYHVEQKHGVNYVVNSRHLLSLKKRSSCYNEKRKGKNGDYIKGRNRYPDYGDLIAIETQEFVRKSERFKDNFRGWKAEKIDYPEQDLPVEPYFLGLWLGDGTAKDQTITTQDEEVKEYIKDYARRLGLSYSEYSKQKTHAVRCAITKAVSKKYNTLKGAMEHIGVLRNKHIPQVYLINSRENRLFLLAGLLDSDGHRPPHKKRCIEITQRSEDLIDQISILSESLGFNATKRKEYNKKYERNYYTLSISGNFDDLPMRVARKIVHDIGDCQYKYNRLRVTPIGKGEYKGVTVDQDHLYILPDRTVVHNSGKSHAVARFILYLCSIKRLRVICAREIQNSIEESVYQLLADMIKEFELDFDVTKSQITHRVTGSAIRFKGCREQGAVSLKSMEGIDILWLEEAQSITQATLDIIIPTIRKENAKIFCTMNRYVRNDPVFSLVGRPQTLHIHIDYFENKFCPQALKDEAVQCQLYNPKDYNYIWLGEPLATTSDYLFNFDKLAKLPHIEPYGGLYKAQRAIGIDFAAGGGDLCVAKILERKSVTHWQTEETIRWADPDTDISVGKSINIYGKYRTADPADTVFVVDSGGLGYPMFVTISKTVPTVIGFDGAKTDKKTPTSANNRAGGYFAVKEFVDQEWLIEHDKQTIKQLETIKKKYKSNGDIFIQSKQDMIRDGIPSPDDADSLMMATWGIKYYMGRQNPAEVAAGIPVGMRVQRVNKRKKI